MRKRLVKASNSKIYNEINNFWTTDFDHFDQGK